tara:strand:- start:174 stop:365 length:192 start_codon:yes stop_codon:yes gene_type:complete
MSDMFCDYQDDKGNCCNNMPDYRVVRADGVTLNLCQFCVDDFEPEQDEKIFVLDIYGGMINNA